MQYSDIKNFDDLCWYFSLYVSDRVKSSPNNRDVEDNE